MARVPITEYAAKKMILGVSYAGIHVAVQKKKEKYLYKQPKLSPLKQYVVKVDQGVKKRMKQGLAAIQLSPEQIGNHIHAWSERGYDSFLIEEMFPHAETEEKYLSFERTRHGVMCTYSAVGGIDVESHPESLARFEIKSEIDVTACAEKFSLNASFIEHIISLFHSQHCALIEMNPTIVRGDQVFPLDAAVLVDDTAHATAWSFDDVVHPPHTTNEYEERVHEIALTTAASLKLRVMNSNGSIFFLLSGGGGSLAIVDSVHEAGKSALIGNYGEYSGGPTREETFLYSEAVIELMLASLSQKKVLVIAGGIANFTDIKSTFGGIIDALSEHIEQIVEQHITVAIRRGGPNERAGLEAITHFLQSAGVSHTIHGSDALITQAADDALALLSKKKYA